MQLHSDFSWMYTRPIVVIIEVAILATIILAARGLTRPKSVRERKAKNIVGPSQSLISFLLTVLLLAVFVGAFLIARGFDDAATGQFPLAVLTVAIPLTLLVLFLDTRACRSGITQAGGMAQAFATASQAWELPAALRFFGYLLALLATTYVAGQLVSLPLFVVLYARRWGNFSWAMSLLYGAASLLLVWGLYAQVMNLVLYPSLLFG
jgi:hypothetical protein